MLEPEASTHTLLCSKPKWYKCSTKVTPLHCGFLKKDKKLDGSHIGDLYIV